MLRDYSPSIDDYIYIESPLHEPHPSSLDLNFLLDNANPDAPIGTFLKILLEDQTGTCPVRSYTLFFTLTLLTVHDIAFS